MKMFFRFHRGGFVESMRTQIELNSLDELIYILVEHRKSSCLSSDINSFKVEYYGYDDRINANCYIVCFGGYPVGFLWYSPEKSC